MQPIPVTLNHVALDVSDPERSVRFYADLLGAEPIAVDPDHGITFLRLPGSPNWSDLALHHHPDRDAAYPPAAMRLAHVGWSVDDARHLVAAYDFFTERTRVVLAADFDVSLSVMGFDPDGNVVELELFIPAAADAAPGFAPLDIDLLRAGTSVAP